eukprot:scaffold7232_cov63-Phaeocystis_antarctica.AAC.1
MGATTVYLWGHGGAHRHSSVYGCASRYRRLSRLVVRSLKYRRISVPVKPYVQKPITSARDATKRLA